VNIERISSSEKPVAWPSAITLELHPSHAMIPKKYAPVLFGLILSGLMSLLVSGISTFRALGLGPHFVGMWTSAWLTAWVVAFPVVLVVAPLARQAVAKLVADK
jgi:hypothetical protein